MSYLVCLNMKRELAKVMRGEKSKLPIEILVYLALRDNPSAQRRFGNALKISPIK